ncbi:MAG TPA: tannase/feruloyl esterase family alpha/beta hydrolase [Bryobacteraceae bacterium]|nr:tannase/feruloyl esterase family alpha/beta hydrolase [Bryobacteraceae bacterium]
MSRILQVLAGAMLAALPAAAQQPCESLTGLSLPNLAISEAASVAAGKFQPPGLAQPVEVPAFCRVVGVVAPEVKFELWMPAAWNRKLLAVGNGGLAGSINYRQMLDPLRRGYATSSTNTGHDAKNNDASWAVGHMQRVIDFAHRAVHVTSQADKAVIEAFYGARPAHAYFSGCSEGGQEALIAAQRYPKDFDGIIAGDPANFWTHNEIGHIWVALATRGDSYIPPGKVALIAQAVNNACDALDGIRDGILNDPRRCHFDPNTLLCKAGDAPDCLTSTQAEAVQKLYDGPGEKIYPGLVPGGEAGPGGWANWMSGAAPGASGHANLGLPFFRFIVFEDPDWDAANFKFDTAPGFDNDVEFTDDKLAAIFNATDPDLSAFRDNGGKLIQYHGWSDPDITPLNSIDYYESVQKATPGAGEFYKLFMVPGMQHCSGGPGPSRFDMLSALEGWVERGVAPEQIVASHVTAAGIVDRTRPLCPYPREAQWTGTGSTDQAENFVCALPKPY